VRGVIEQFDRRVTCYPPNLQNIARTTPVCRDRGAGLSHYLPFWLDDTLLSGTQRLAARQCALANRFGQVFCLLRDAILDESDDAERSVLLPADALFLDFIRCYQDLFPADHAFWNHFERSWHEYLDALAWEARHARRALPYEHRDVMRLGKKLSPLKICCAAMTLLADRRELLPALETLIEDLHIACQLVDDIRDWNEDLRLGHWSWALTLAREQLHGVSSPAAVEEALIEGGVALRVLDTAIDHLERARLTAHHLSLTAFEHWVAELHEVVRSARHAVAQRRLASHPFVVFREGNRCVALNTSTLGLFSIDQDLAAVLENTLQGSALDDSTTSMMDDVGLLEIGDPVAAEPSVVPLVYVTSRAILSYGDQALERGLKQLLLTYSFPTLRMVIRQDRNATLDVRTLTNIMVKGNEAATAVDKRISFSVIYDAANVDLNSAAAIGEVNGTIVLSQQPLRGDEDVRRICEVAKRIRETGCLKLELDAELEGYRGCVVDVLSQLETARFELISIQSNHATPAATQHEHAKLVELFATSLEEGHCIPIVSILQPLIALCRRKRHVTLCRGCCRDFILDVNGVHPRSMCSARRTEVAVVASGSKRNLADPSILGATAAKDSVLCRVCWARYLCDADCSDLDLIVAGKLCNPDQVICELRRERCARIVKLAARVEAHLPGLAQRWGGDDLRRGHN
jgi:hypothetical protein